jgi:hypothetical protein
MLLSALSLNTDKLKDKEAPRIPFEEILEGQGAPDIYVEYTQEDARSPDSAALVVLPGGFRMIEKVSLNPGKTSQNMMLRVWSSMEPQRKDKGATPYMYRDTTKGALVYGAQAALSSLSALGVKKGYTKGAIWIQLEYGSVNFLFVNIHLPLLTSTNPDGSLKDPSLGYEYRAKVLMDVLEKLKARLNSKTFILVGGDLNFRMTSTGEDQLVQLLQQGPLPIPLKEIEPPAGQHKTFTCKFEEKDDMEDLDMRSCRETPINTGAPFEEISRTVQDTCGNEDRVPSRCDRFLIHKGSQADVKLMKSKVLLPSSDHNAIYTLLSVEENRYNASRSAPASPVATRRSSLINYIPGLRPRSSSEDDGGFLGLGLFGGAKSRRSKKGRRTKRHRTTRRQQRQQQRRRRN